jgi:hypothetical protein
MFCGFSAFNNHLSNRFGIWPCRRVANLIKRKSGRIPTPGQDRGPSVCAKTALPGKVSTAADEAISALRETFIWGFREEASAVASEFRDRVSPILGTLGAAYVLSLRPGRWKWSGVYFNEPASWRSGCWECLDHWCNAFPGKLKAFVADLCELGHSIDTAAKELEDICVLISSVESRNWLACFCGDGNPAATDWRAPGWLLDWPDELEAGALLEAPSNGRLDYGQTKEVCEAIRNTVEEYLLPAKEAALNHARIVIAKENNRTRREKSGWPEDFVPGSVSRPVERGKFCDQVCIEAKKVKRMYLGGRGMAEIQNEFPHFAIWKVRQRLCPEDREIFDHPRQWGPSYEKMILARTEGISEHTVTASLKAYRKSQKTGKR